MKEMKAQNDCEIACDCVKRANVDLHVRLCKEIFARKHTATHKPTSAQPTHMCHDDTHTHTHTHIHTRINRLWSPLAYGLGGNNRLWSPLAYGLGGNKLGPSHTASGFSIMTDLDRSRCDRKNLQRGNTTFSVSRRTALAVLPKRILCAYLSYLFFSSITLPPPLSLRIARNEWQVLLEKVSTGHTLKSNALYFGYHGVMAVGFER